MTGIPADSAVTSAKLHAATAWRLFNQERKRAPQMSAWQVGTAPDGQPCITAEVTGPDAAYVLRRFASQYHLVLGRPGDVRPQFDYSVPGRTACVWRSGGVWVELWHPDTVADLPTATPGRGRLLARASARLPFTRRPVHADHLATVAGMDDAE